MAVNAEECNIFAIAPVEMARDHRLTAAQYRVLLAILSFRNKIGNVAFPSRKKLAQRSGYTENSISKYSSQLEKLGWLKKEGKGGYGKATRYTLTVPDLDAEEEKTLSNPETVSKVETVSNPATKTLSNPDRGIEQTIEQTNTLPNGRVSAREKSARKQPSKLDTSNLPISPDLAEELIEYRRQMKKPLTQRALNALAKAVDDAAKACGLTHEQTVAEIQLAGWQSVKPEWLHRRLHSSGGSQKVDKHSGFDQRDYSKGATQEEPAWVREAGV